MTEQMKVSCFDRFIQHYSCVANSSYVPDGVFIRHAKDTKYEQLLFYFEY